MPRKYSWASVYHIWYVLCVLIHVYVKKKAKIKSVEVICDQAWIKLLNFYKSIAIQEIRNCLCFIKNIKNEPKSYGPKSYGFWNDFSKNFYFSKQFGVSAYDIQVNNNESFQLWSV